MIRHIGLALTLTAIAAGPALAQPPAPPGPQLQGVPVLPDQANGQRGPERRNRQVFGDPGGFLNGGRTGGPGGRALPSGPAPAPAVAGPPAQPADTLVMRRLQGSVSAVFDPGAKTARIKLIETDDHGVEGMRMLKPGDLYRDGWRIGAVNATGATLRKGKTLLHVDLTRGWPAQPPAIQAAVLVQPALAVNTLNGGRAGFSLPAGAAGQLRGLSARPPGRGGTAPGAGLGLSNALVGGSPPPRPSQILQGPNGSTINIQNNADGSRTMTTNVNGQTMVMTIQGGQ